MTMYCGRMTTTDQIAERVNNARIAEGRSVAWLSTAAGIPDKTLRRRFTNPGSFKLVELSAIARVLHREVEEFFATQAKEDAAA